MHDAERKIADTPKRTKWDVKSPTGDLTKDQLYKFRRAYEDLDDEPVGNVAVLMGPPRTRGRIRPGHLIPHAREIRLFRPYKCKPQIDGTEVRYV